MEVLQPTTDWSGLPEHILVEIFSYLPLNTRFHASLVCVSWSQCFKSCHLWSTVKISFNKPAQESFTDIAKTYGTFMKYVVIECDQSLLPCRLSVIKFLDYLIHMKEWRIKYFKLKFTGQNPYFYAGIEFVNALIELFGPRPDGCKMVNHLTEVDLGSLMVAYDDKLFNVLSQFNKHIEKLNIQNRMLVCKVSPTCILRLVQRCRKLRHLSLFNYSLSDEVLMALTEDDRAPLEYLSLKCRREEKFIKDTSNMLWRALARKLPKLRVSLIFDYTCPANRIAAVMKPDIPVCELHLETFTYIYDEVRHAATMYKDTLETFVLQTPMSRNSPELNSSLILLATDCKKLKELHIYCPVDKEVADQILEACPHLKEYNTYTFK